MPPSELAVLLLGSNLGHSLGLLGQAIEQILARELGQIEALSGVYESAPWGFEHANVFLNQAVCLRTHLSADQLLTHTQAIERALGRGPKTASGYQARTMDIDLLFLGHQCIDLPHLTVPHVGIAHRRFVLVPLNELMPHWMHPLLCRTMAQLLASCTDTGYVALHQPTR